MSKGFCACAGVYAYASTPLLKGPGIFSPNSTKLFRPTDEVNATLNAENFLVYSQESLSLYLNLAEKIGQKVFKRGKREQQQNPREIRQNKSTSHLN